MLDELIVANLGIIERAHIEPGRGLVVITGETGAGKTMLLGALRLLMGASSKREAVGPHDAELVVDGRFLFDEAEVTLRRRVTAEGRSKAYIDGGMVPAKALQERTAGHVEVIAQNDHMLLTTDGGARRLLDSALDEKGREAATAYAAAWEALTETRQKLELLGGGRRQLERELEIVRFQAEEIGGAGFERGDDLELQGRVTRLRNSEDLAEGFAGVLAALGEDAAATQVATAARELGRLARIDPALGDVSDRVGDVAALLGEVHVEVAALAADLEHDPAELDELEQRIQGLGDLRRKYGDNLDEILSFGEQAAARATELEQLLGAADDLAEELAARQAEAGAAAEGLSAARRQAGKRLSKQAVAHLRELGMATPHVQIELQSIELGPTGADRVSLRFASDRSLTPGPVTRVASGGELSRLTLALRLAAGIGDAAVLAFDEVDAGIGGATALAMGEKLASLSKGRQIFCVTHLPQVAAYADTHIIVERRGASATVRPVGGDDRLAELSRMLGGLADSERGQLHAAELLATAARS